MKICQYVQTNQFPRTPRLGILLGDGETIVDANWSIACEYEREGYLNPHARANHKLPSSLFLILNHFDNPIETIEEGYATYLFLQKLGIDRMQDGTPISFSLNSENCELANPIDKIGTYRDFYAHEKHVKKGFEKRGEPVPPAWYEMPVYYKGPTHGFIGPKEEILWPSYSDKLDYELELAVVLGRDGKNLKPHQALENIFGYTILNDVSARDIQKKEMSVRLGPSKGKDFCSVLGPVIVTADEFYFEEPNLLMTASINGKEWSRGHSGDSQFSFAEMIVQASKEEWLQAGDVIGSGTVGTGCGLELDKWIKPGDEIDLYVENIGHLVNKVGQRK